MSGLRTLGARVAAAWSQFWFREADSRTLGLMRIVLGVVLVVPHVAMWGDLELLYGNTGVVSVDLLAESRGWGAGLRDLFWQLSEPLPLQGLWLVGLVAHVAVLLGVRSRLALGLSLAVQVWFYHRNSWCQHGGDRVLRMATMYMLVAPAGAAWSWDAWRGRGRAAVPVLAQRLVQLQLCLIYMHSGWVKSKGGTWHRGEALHYALANRQYQRMPELLDALLPSPLVQLLCQLGTWITLAWEAGFGLLMLWAPTRVVGLLVGVLVHGGIFATMMVGSFSFVMLWSYLAFLPDGWVERLHALRARLR
jgi:hypothetical protein